MAYRNLVEMHRRQAERFGLRPALRYRRLGLWRTVTWDRYRDEAQACAAGLIEAGVQPGDRIGLWSENRIEWLIADLGILGAAAVNVPAHAPLTAAQLQFQFANTEIVWLFASNQEQTDKVRGVWSQLPALRGIVVFDGPAALGTIPWKAFLQSGRRALARQRSELARREAQVGPEALATIIYTSGTTGEPKGVMLTHGNLLSNTLACRETWPRHPDAVILNWLPFSHIYARTVDHYLSIAQGITVCLATAPETVLDEVREVQPTQMSSVPRFYERVLKALTVPDADATRARLRAAFGSRLQWVLSGGAPLPASIAETYAAAGILVLQGYGLTETSPVISFNRPDRYRFESVGPLLPGVEVQIAGDGELLTRGPHIMAGYWRNPAATASALRDGWLYTGDLGRLGDGFLFITGRKKELLVLSNGKKVVPTYIESLLLADECIEQAVVCGEGRPFLTALLVPNWDNVRRAVSALSGIVSEVDLARSSELESFLELRIERALADVSPWERVKRFALLPRPLTVAADELTVSLKLRRDVVLRKHDDLLAALYQSSAVSGEDAQ
jgi:long-chain acyl-CoA synthetase